MPAKPHPNPLSPAKAGVQIEPGEVGALLQA